MPLAQHTPKSNAGRSGALPSGSSGPFRHTHTDVTWVGNGHTLVPVSPKVTRNEAIVDLGSNGRRTTLSARTQSDLIRREVGVRVVSSPQSTDGWRSSSL